MQIGHIRTLRTLSTALGFLIYALLAISMFNTASSLAGSVTPDNEGEPINVDIDPASGDAVFALKVKNNGILSSTMRMKVQIVSGDNVVSEGEDSIELSPEGEHELAVKLKLTGDQMNDLAEKNSRVFFTFESRGLNGLVGMGTKFEGGLA